VDIVLPGPGAGGIIRSIDLRLIIRLSRRKDIHLTTGSTETIDEEISVLEREVKEAQERLEAARRRRPPEPVKNYSFAGPQGARVTLAEVFGKWDDLLLIHNMGQRCSYCTLWADELNGVLPYLLQRTAVVVASPDTPDEQESFGSSRGGRFPLLSDPDGQFTREMGFLTEANRVWPGVSSFRREANGELFRIARSIFGPGDMYCSVWHFLELLKDADAGWKPGKPNLGVLPTGP